MLIVFVAFVFLALREGRIVFPDLCFLTPRVSLRVTLHPHHSLSWNLVGGCNKSFSVS